MIRDLITIVTHVVTQILGLWLPAPARVRVPASDFAPSVLERYQRFGASGLDSLAWLEFLESSLSAFSDDLNWLHLLLKSRRIDLPNISQAAAKHFSAMESAGGKFMTIFDWNYPPLLRQIARPPLVISMLGDADLMVESVIAVIGSRRASYEALHESVKIGQSCAREGMAVVSGGAIGCDIAVHEGMLSTASELVKAIVVMAGGLARLYPRSNVQTFDEIVDRGGLIISERLWFQNVRPRDFPIRNRIVSGMSQCAIVMAASKRSGSLITASEALEQGRDVYVYAGIGDDVRFEGSQNLIEDGATPFLSASDLIPKIINNYINLTDIPGSIGLSYCQ